MELFVFARFHARPGNYVHSRWADEAAFERHAGLPHTVRVLARLEPLIDHPLDVTRAERIG